MKTITIEIPDDCEVQIIKKRKESEIKTYQDLINNYVYLSGYTISNTSDIISHKSWSSNSSKNLALSEKVTKSMLAMAMISQLMPYYGGEITDKEWHEGKSKYIIQKCCNKIKTIELCNTYYFLAFHTAEQRDNFLKYNKQLVKDYLMID